MNNKRKLINIIIVVLVLIMAFSIIGTGIFLHNKKGLNLFQAFFYYHRFKRKNYQVRTYLANTLVLCFTFFNNNKTCNCSACSCNRSNTNHQICIISGLWRVHIVTNICTAVCTVIMVDIQLCFG